MYIKTNKITPYHHHYKTRKCMYKNIIIKALQIFFCPLLANKSSLTLKMFEKCIWSIMTAVDTWYIKCTYIVIDLFAANGYK